MIIITAGECLVLVNMKMNNRMLRLNCFLGALIIFVSGCAPVGELQEGIQTDHETAREGKEREYPEKADQVNWKSGATGQLESIPEGVAVASDAKVVALDGENGNQLWRYGRLDGGIQAHVSHPTGEVFVAPEAENEDGTTDLFVIDSSTGAIENNFQSSLELNNYSLIGGGFGYSAAMDQVSAYSLASEEEVWRTADTFQCELGSDLDSMFGDFAYTGDVVVASFVCAENISQERGVVGDDGSQSSGVLAVDAVDGDELWRVEEEGDEDILDAGASLSLNLSQDFVLQNRVGVGAEGGLDQSARVLDLRDGEEKFSHEGRLIGFNAEGGGSVVYDSSSDAFKRLDYQGVEESKAEVPGGCSIGLLDERSVALDDGVLFGCEGPGGVIEELRWLSWEENGSDGLVDLAVEYDEISEVVAVPGSVVAAYARDGEQVGVVGIS